MKTLLIITAEYFENYGFAEGKEHWKKKGIQTFSLNVDSSAFCYAEKECVDVIHKLLEGQNNNLTKYAYVTHELIFHEPIKLDDTAFEKYLNEMF